MGTKRRLLLRDFGLGVGGLALLALIWGRPPSLVDVPVIAGVALVDIYCQYLSEHEAFPAWVYAARDYGRTYPPVAVAATAVVIVVALTPLYLVPSSIRWYFDAFFGGYIGFIGYRVLYGVVRPVPDVALSRL